LKAVTAQSILDLINVLPLQAVERKAPITNKEAQTLLDIWKSEKDVYGKHIVPKTADQQSIFSLITKGYIQNEFRRYSDSANFTKAGKEAIKKMILHSKSVFSQKSGDIDYQSIYLASLNEK